MNYKNNDIEEYYKNPKKCSCGKVLSYEKRFGKYCNRSCAAKYNNLKRGPRSEETKQKISKTIKKRINEGLLTGFVNNPDIYNKFIEQKKITKCKYCGKEFWNSTLNPERYNHIYCSKECKEKYHNEIYLPKIGGYRNGSGRGKSGWYKGIHCDSSWELAFVIYHLDHNLNIQRYKEQRKYIYNGIEHKYIPDFITDEGIIEIKGYRSEQWEAKQQQNPDIKVIYKEDIKIYLDYVIHKYGIDFIRMYDNSKPIYNHLYNLNIWVHKYDDTNKIYYTKVINPIDLEIHINNGWIKGRGKTIEDYKKEHIITNNIFKR